MWPFVDLGLLTALGFAVRKRKIEGRAAGNDAYAGTHRPNTLDSPRAPFYEAIQRLPTPIDVRALLTNAQPNRILYPSTAMPACSYEGARSVTNSARESVEAHPALGSERELLRRVAVS